MTRLAEPLIILGILLTLFVAMLTAATVVSAQRCKREHLTASCHTISPAGEGEAPQVTARVTRVAPAKADRSRPLTTPRAVGNGELPRILLAIRRCESNNDYTARNPHSTASGAWQILDGTWNHFGGYRRAVDAPRDVQDRKALALYRDRGTSPWACSRGCWG